MCEDERLKNNEGELRRVVHIFGPGFDFFVGGTRDKLSFQPVIEFQGIVRGNDDTDFEQVQSIIYEKESFTTVVRKQHLPVCDCPFLLKFFVHRV